MALFPSTGPRSPCVRAVCMKSFIAVAPQSSECFGEGDSNSWVRNADKTTYVRVRGWPSTEGGVKLIDNRRPADIFVPETPYRVVNIANILAPTYSVECRSGVKGGSAVTVLTENTASASLSHRNFPQSELGMASK